MEVSFRLSVKFLTFFFFENYMPSYEAHFGWRLRVALEYLELFSAPPEFLFGSVFATRVRLEMRPQAEPAKRRSRAATAYI